MSTAIQVAFQVDAASLAAIDSLATQQRQSRAEVLRSAVHDYLAKRREDEVDAAFLAGYAAVPPGAEEDALARRSVAGLQAADLDW